VRCPPPFGPTMKIFYRRLYMKRCAFAIFQQKLQNSTMVDGLLRFQISEKWANLRFPLNIQKQKVFQLPPTRGSAPGPRWGLRPQTPVMGSRSARSPWPPLCQILNTPLVLIVRCRGGATGGLGGTCPPVGEGVHPRRGI